MNTETDKIQRQQEMMDKAHADLLQTEHELITDVGLLKWLAAVGLALTHDLPQMHIDKAAVCVKLSHAALNILKTDVK